MWVIWLFNQFLLAGLDFMIVLYTLLLFRFPLFIIIDGQALDKVPRNGGLKTSNLQERIRLHKDVSFLLFTFFVPFEPFGRIAAVSRVLAEGAQFSSLAGVVWAPGHVVFGSFKGTLDPFLLLV